jgi:ATP synthase protein I
LAAGDEETDKDGALQARLDALSSALDTQGRAQAGKPEQAPETEVSSVGSAMSLGFRVLTEFAAAVVVGALVGWQIDVWAKTLPVFLIIFLVLGTAAGFWNVYRIAVRPTGGAAGKGM